MLFKKLKKVTVLQVAVLLLAAAFAMVIAACPGDITARIQGDGSTTKEIEPENERRTPVADDFHAENLNQTEGSVSDVTITAKDGKSKGKITIYYNSSTVLPSSAGTYPVTFDVAASGLWNAANGLKAGNLIIGDRSKTTPHANDYTVNGSLNREEGDVSAITVTAKDGKLSGQVTVYYAGAEDTSYDRSTTLPREPGQYEVTFDVEGTDTHNPASALSAGTLIIKGTPAAGDFIIANLNQTHGSSIIPVTITPKEGKSTGHVTIYYNNSITQPSAVGRHHVTFNVAEAPPVWHAANGLSAGDLVIDEAPKNYISGPDALSWGVESQASVLTLGLTPGNTTRDIRLTWYSSGGTTTGKVAHVRFVKGTFTEGTNLKTVTTGGTVAATAAFGASTCYHKVAVSDYFEPGASYQYSVSSNGTAWSKVYDYKVPAAAGTFKIGIVADPQISTTANGGSWDTNNRYTPVTTGSKSAASWKDTMDYLVTKDISLILCNGDQVDTWGGNENDYTNLFAPDGMKSIPFGPVMGNHDGNILYGGASAAGTTNNMFFYHFNIPNEKGTANSNHKGANYYYLYNNVLIVSLNTMSYPNNKTDAASYIPIFRTTINAAKTAFPKEGDAQGNNKWDWLIIQHHKSTASVGDHCADTEIQYFVEAGFETLMSEVGADFVIAGHDHVYARSYPLQGMGDGKVSVPDKSNGDSRTYTNPGKPIYLTIGPSSGLKYFSVNVDPYFKYNNTLDKKDNASYPYFGTDANGTATSFGSAAYLAGNLPVSNAAFQQPYIPSYTIVEVNGKTIKFSTYPVYTLSGQSPGASQAYNFNRDVPYDWVEVTKN